MKVRNAWPSFAAWFDALKLRERALIIAAAMAVLFATFNTLVLQRLEARKTALSLQLADIVTRVQDTAGAVSAAAASGQQGALALAQARALSANLARTTARLQSQSAGLIAPQRMTQVIHDVLSRERGLELISLRSLAPHALLLSPAEAGGPITPTAAAAEDPAAAASAAQITAGPAPAGTVLVPDQGPYVHTVVLVLQGRYLDTLAYLQALERLPWHFYWQTLDLDATHYPVTRVTVTLGTVSMSREWIDL